MHWCCVRTNATPPPPQHKPVVIVDIIDQNRVLVNGPSILRSQMHFTELALTPIVVDVGRGARQKAVKKALAKAGAIDKFNKLSSVQVHRTTCCSRKCDVACNYRL